MRSLSVLTLAALLPLPAPAETPLPVDLQENLPSLDRVEVAGGTLSVAP